MKSWGKVLTWWSCCPYKRKRRGDGSGAHLISMAEVIGVKINNIKETKQWIGRNNRLFLSTWYKYVGRQPWQARKGAPIETLVAIILTFVFQP